MTPDDLETLRGIAVSIAAIIAVIAAYGGALYTYFVLTGGCR